MWKPLEEFLHGVVGNMGLSAARFDEKLAELKYYIEFGKMPSMEDLVPEIARGQTPCMSK